MHVMIDLETMGLVPGCAVLSIGAVAFNPTITEPANYLVTKSWRIDLLSSVMAGLHVDEKTAQWWREQSDEAQTGLFAGESLSLYQALNQFRTFWADVEGTHIWANGPSADISWLEAAYQAVGLKHPWTHRQPRCYRTIVELAGITNEERTIPAVAHDALEDARAQTLDVIEAMRRLAARGDYAGASPFPS